MFIPLPIGSLRVAAAACIAAQLETLTKYKERLAEGTYTQLRNGAVHNGMTVTAARETEMREMAARDVEHMLEQHPSKEVIEHLEAMLAQAAYYEGNEPGGVDVEVVIDTEEFKLLRDYLPAK